LNNHGAYRPLPALVCRFCGLFSIIAAIATASAVQPAQVSRPKLSKHNWTGVWIVEGGLIDKGDQLGPQDSTAGMQPDLRSPYKEKYQALRDAEAQGQPLSDPTAACYPAGMPRMMNMPYTMEIMMVPGQVNITGEWQGITRRIYTDGRKHPKNVEPSYNGHSTGHWDADTLIVETVGLKQNVALNQAGLPHSANTQLMERFRLIDRSTLEDEITVIDPDAFLSPWKVVRHYFFRPDLEVMEYVCEANNRHFDP
jgi:hypothetical protein